MSFTQDGRLFSLNTPLGKDVLLLKDITGEEGISGLYSFHLNLLSENHSISFKDIIGKNVTISAALADGKTRYFNGIVSEFSQSRAVEQGKADILLSYYTATVVPWLWLLTRTTDSRIFQNMTVSEIVEKIFVEKKLKDFKLNLKGKYGKREYCVQYRETDFNFISRLLEDEGIFYFFQHEDGKHTLILADDPGEHHPCPEQGTARCRPHEGGGYDEDMIDTLLVKQEIRAGKYTLNDYNFEMPNTNLKTEVPGNQKLGPDEREYYDYPGGYGKKSEGDRLANIRMQEEEARITTFQGTCNCRAFTSGYRFKLEDFYRDDMNNKEYVLTGIKHEGSQTYSRFDTEEEQTYKNEFTCIPFDVPYRHPRNTPKPFVQGAQTAIVVGPGGEEIYTDKYGRVKVQFHWDREGKKNENSSCWIRVSQVWAGSGWGAMHIPHVGHEVIIDFIEGDPDRPIITGCVYNGNNKPPDELPANKTKNYIQSWGDNDIIFENKDGDKCIHIKQSCGNEIRMHESSPDIEIKQKCGNEVLMKASGPDIDIKQACGNQILMHAAEGIHMKDKYGNEVKLDAVAGFMRLASPTHNSYIELGKSLKFNTDSTLEAKYGSNTNWKVFGYSNELNVGGKTEEFLGVKLSTVNGFEYKRNYAYVRERGYSRQDKIISAELKLDSQSTTKLIGGYGDADINKIVLTDQGEVDILIESTDTKIEFMKGGDLKITTPKKIEISADGGIVISSKGEIKIGKGMTMDADGKCHFSKDIDQPSVNAST